jgi:hypothetical protein
MAVNVPDVDPDVELVYTTLNLADWPGFISMGVASPEVANSVELDASSVIVTASLPVLVSVAVCVAFCPTATPAKVMSDGKICTASCGVGFALAVFAKPAQPLTTVPPHVTMANIAAIPHPRRLPAFDWPARFVFAAFTLAICSSPHPFREAEYGFDARKKYWLDVHITDRRAPVPVNMVYFQYLFSVILQKLGPGFLLLGSCSDGRVPVPTARVTL